MNCEQARVLISARLDREIQPDDLAPLDAHVAQCASCQAAAEALQAQDADLRRAFLPRRQAAAAVAERVIGQLQATPVSARKQSGRLHGRGWRLAWVVTATAAAACLALLLPSWLHKPTPPTTPTDEPARANAHPARDPRGTLTPRPRPAAPDAQRVAVGQAIRTGPGE